MTEFHTTQTGTKLAYNRLEGEGPGVVFMGGFRSDMQGTKAMVLEDTCRQLNVPYLRFDYQGHGESSGEFEDGTIGEWASNAIEAIDHLTQGPQIVIGSSMGGWMMLLTALARPERVAAMIGIAAAPDFLVNLMQAQFTPEQKATYETEGKIALPSDYGEPYIISKQLVEESLGHMLLNKAMIEYEGPVHLLHGMRDDAVPWQVSVEIADKLASEDVKLHFVKEAGHSFSEPDSLALLGYCLHDFLLRLR